jgi:hypothetical protein
MRLEPLPAPIPAEGVCATYSLARCAGTLVVSVQGEASNRRECSGTYRIIDEAMMLVCREFRPSSLVFDFSELKYEWGDGMGELLGTWGLPIAIVTSPKNQHALTTLLTDEADWEGPLPFFSSCEAAITAVQKQEPNNGAT